MPVWQGPWGAQSTLNAEEDAVPQSFACGQCGAVLAFEPGTESLACAYCGHTNEIKALKIEIDERDLHQALAGYAKTAPEEVKLTQNCENCAGEFTFFADQHAGLCPYCSTPTVQPPANNRPVAPDGLLPFLIGDAEAQRLMRNWLKKLWFAPSKLAEHASEPDSLHGAYLPYFTFDSETDTTYRGQRGDIYYETVRVRQNINGKSVMRTQRVPKIRWTPVSGRVQRFFDDVLVPATGRQDRKLLDKIDHWDLLGLKPYRDSYLSGFESSLYDRTVHAGRKDAEEIMKSHIAFDIRRQIGGDQQRIQAMQVQHSDEKFKLILLPVWTTVFAFLGKRYPVFINGRTGEVAGHRPYSLWKIAGAVLLALIILGIAAGVAAVAR